MTGREITAPAPRGGRIDTPVPLRIPVASRPRVRTDGKFFARDGQRLIVQGVTYGPFAPNLAGEAFPEPAAGADDFARMVAAGINSIRTYHVPPDWLLHAADEAGLAVLVDVPWPRHMCFLDSREAANEARRNVRHAAKRGREHACLLGYSIGNEVPPDVVRWHGRRRIERFLAELADTARQADPEALITYANYPPTEYLDLPFLDFATFNVYLHDPETFRRYLFRLQNLVGDRPLVLGEIGMDTRRHGEVRQAEFLSGHFRETVLMGLAGAFAFAWTDEWFTGGHPIRDWEFGITYADRSPKASLHALREVFDAAPHDLLPAPPPRVSVIVCSYNGGGTLDQCLRSLMALEYPDFEVIVVDDGSTDNTQAVLARYPAVRAIRQTNLGLSAARNAGLQAATGSVIAYTDADCYADPRWLTQLVYQLQRTDASAVGGPNLTPDDGWLAACVAAAPGQPTHVLESDQVAEHIPGCNMAFLRESLLAVNGFDPVYRQAGDDVDLCWRLQQAGYWITFAPGAFVWHHRRQTPAAFLRQQSGYGEAEALLRFKHPDRFNGRGDGKWRGELYGSSLRGLRLGGAMIYGGTFGTGMFQCLYQPAPSHWAMLPATLEWHLLAVGVSLGGFAHAALWGVAGLMFVLSLIIALLQASQARLNVRHDGWRSRLLVAALCYLQPLVRSAARYHTRLFAYRAPVADAEPRGRPRRRLPLSGTLTEAYWSESGCGRLRLLGCLVAYLNERRWGKTVDTGWSDWDIEVYCHHWTIVQLSTAEENHGADRRLVRVRYRLRSSGYLQAVAAAAGAAIVATWWWPWVAGPAAAALTALAAGLWARGAYRAAQARAAVDQWAEYLGFVRCAAQASPSAGTERRGKLSRLARRLDAHS